MPSTPLRFEQEQPAEPPFTGIERGVPTDMAVQLKGNGVVHVVGIGNIPNNPDDPDASDTDDEDAILYANNRWETRGSNSFSPPFKVESAPVGISFDDNIVQDSPRIAVTPDGQAVTIAWLLANHPSDTQALGVYVRTLKPEDGGWGATQLVAESAEATYGTPEIFYGRLGKLHMTVSRETVKFDDQDNEIHTVEILHSGNLLNGAGFSTVASGSFTVNDSSNGTAPVDYPLFDSSLVSAHVQDGESLGQVAWLQVKEARFSPITAAPTPTKVMIMHWSAETRVAEMSDSLAVSGFGGYAFTVDGDEDEQAVGAQGNAHFAFVQEDQLNYRRRSVDGSPESFEPVPIPEGASPDNPKIDVDGRGKPVILYQNTQENNEGLNLATKVTNPDWCGDPAPCWATQAPIPFGAAGPLSKLQIARDAIHYLTVTIDELIIQSPTSSTSQAAAVFVVAAEYGRAADYNLGNQDALAMHPAAPNASVNVSNGNLFVDLPVFASRGAGFATAFSLRYNSLEGDGREPGPLSSGWTHTYNMMLTRHGSVCGHPRVPLSLRLGDGRIVIFTFDAKRGFYLAMDEFGYFSKIVCDAPAPGEYEMTDKLGTIYRFRSDGKLAEVRDTNDNTHTFAYGANDESTITEVSLGAGVHEQVLTTITDSMDQPTKLRYDELERLDEIEDPARKRYKLTYDAAARLQTVEFAAAPGPKEVAWRFEYHNDNQESGIDGVPDAFRRKRLLGRLFTPRGNNENVAHEFFYLKDRRLRVAREPLTEFVTDDGSPETTQARYVFSYVDKPPGQTQKVIVRNRRDFDTTVEYESRRSLALKVTDTNGHFIRRTFDSAFRNLVTFRDKRGVETEYTYVPQSEATPDYVRDNLHTIVRKAGDSPPGAPLPPVEYTYTADGLNRVKRVTDAKGAVTTYEYDGAGNLTDRVYQAAPVVQADGSTVTKQSRECFVYDPAVGKGRLTRSTSPNGLSDPTPGSCPDNEFSTRYVYDDSKTGLATAITRPEHTKPEAFTYDAMGNTLTHTLPEGGTATFVLDGLYRVEKRIEPSGDIPDPTTTFGYDENSNVKSVTDPRGKTTVNDYDNLDRLRETTNPEGKTQSYDYDREGNIRRVEDLNGHVTVSSYDELNRLEREERPGPPAQVTTFVYDPNGNLSEKVEEGESSRSTTFTYDVRNNLRTTVQPDASIVDENCYDANDNPFLAQRRTDGVFESGTFSRFDARNRLIESVALTSDPGTGCQARDSNISGPSTEYGYDANGNRRTVSDPNDNVMSFTYDGSDRMVGTFDAEGIEVSRTLYNDNDLRQEVKVQGPDGSGLITAQTFFYNDRNELKAVADAFGNATAFSHDANGNLARTTDAEGNVTEFEYNDLNRLIVQRESATPDDPIVTRFFYDPNGNQVQITDPRGKIYCFEYDGGNRLGKLRYPPLEPPSPELDTCALIADLPADFETWTYTDHGELASHTDANGKTATYQYDALGRLVSEEHKKGGATLALICRGYDGAGNLLFVREMDRSECANGTSKREVLFEDPATDLPGYDTLNRLTHIQWLVDGSPFKELAYNYDAASNRETMTGPEGETTTYTYDANNRLQTVKRDGQSFATFIYGPGGLLDETRLGNGVSITRSYDNKERLTNISALKSDGATLSSFTYDYDAIDRRTSMSIDHLDTTVNYSYDGLSRLTGESWSGQIPYSAIYAYDPAGNRILKDGSTGTSTYEYDERNRLIKESRTTEAPEPVPPADVMVDSTLRGFSSRRISDGDTTDHPGRAFAWWSKSSDRPHFAGLSFAEVHEISSISLYIPTKLRGIRRFKPQYWTGTKWIDLTVTAVTGARPNPEAPGWLETVSPVEHRIELAVEPVGTTRIRILQDVRGGSAVRTAAFDLRKVMVVNELQAFAQGLGEAVVVYSHDDNGNLVGRTEGGVAESFGYDHANRLTSYKKIDPSATLADFSYSFMPTGERLSKSDLLDGPTEWFMYDQADVLADYEGTAAQTARLTTSYVNNLVADSKVARIQPDASRLFYLIDGLGSIHQLTDDGQNVINQYLTTAWGEDLIDQRQMRDRYGFAGRERDQESILMHFRARAYDPQRGRFLQPDPLQDGKSRGPYTYGLNMPVSATDPSGLKTEIVTPGALSVKDSRALVSLSFITVATDVGSDAEELQNASGVAKRLTEAVHERWGQDGFGWRLRVRQGGQVVEKNLYFVPWVFAVSRRIQGDRAFAGYDKVWIADKKGSEVGATPYSPHAVKTYTGTPIPAPVSSLDYRSRGIPYPGSVTHSATFAIGGSGREYGHEFGHLLGMADRYHYEGLGTPVSDPGWEKSLMGVSATKADQIDIQELGRVLLGLDVVSARRNSVQLFSGPFEPGALSQTGLSSVGPTGMSWQINPDTVSEWVKGWREWERVPE